MKIAIIDDDFFARRNIIEQINWQQLSYPEIKEYSNGPDLLRDIDKEAFDIIITDIKMADMDGVEIARIIQERFPKVKIIFISAYPEKEYLKSAIKLKAVDFIEKPINMEDLQNTLMNLLSILQVQKGQVGQDKTMIDQFVHLEWMEQMCTLLIHNETSDPLFRNLADYFHFQKTDYSYSLCISFKLFDLKDQINAFRRMEISLLSTVVKDYQKENIEQFFMHKTDYLIVVICAKLHSQAAWQNYISSLCNLYLSFLNDLGLRAICGIGEPVTTFCLLVQSYQQSMSALQQAYYTEKVLNYYIIPTLPAFNMGSYYLAEYKKLILLQNREKTFQLLETLKNSISSNCNTLISDTINIYYELLELLWKQAQEMQLSIFHSIKTKTDLISKLNSFFIYKYLCEYVLHVNEEYFDQIQKNDYGNKFVNKMANYIDLNYSNPDLQILSISEDVCLAPNYANHIFKKYTHITLNQYIQKIRMQIAKRLLENTDDTLDHIAGKVGITGNAYFTKVFMKQFGLSPNEYRRRYYEDKR